MKNFMENAKLDRFKYISVVYSSELNAVKLMIQEHYDTIEYEGTLFLINTCGIDIDTLLSDFNYTRCIYYVLEHTKDYDESQRDDIHNYLKNHNVTEIWSMEPNCELFDVGLKIKFKPMRYTSYIERTIPPTEPKFDLGFIGIVGSNNYSPRRNDFLEKYIRTPEYDYSMKILNGYPISELEDELSNCRFILDTHRNYRHCMQNQVRIFEHICLGHTVLSEKSEYNIFPGLIYEWENADELNELVKTVTPSDFSQEYKEMTYTDEAYEKYINKILYDNYLVKMQDYFSSKKYYRYDLINDLIDKIGYKTYLEIGVFNGECLYNINPTGDCWKVGVDPDPQSAATCHLTSDKFFEILDNDGFGEIKHDFKFDIIFIDGLHLWEQCYHDITNALNHLSPNGVIICHDMNPLEEMFQRRYKGESSIWNGDVWKAFVKLRTERNDVFSCMIEDCDTGLGIITWGMQQPIVLDKPFDKLTFSDFQKNKAYLMNTVKLNDFIERNNLQRKNT